jgi:hypothetical protein
LGDLRRLDRRLKNDRLSYKSAPHEWFSFAAKARFATESSVSLRAATILRPTQKLIADG